MTIDEMKDRIARAEEIQRYTENRCETLEKENAELKEANETLATMNNSMWVELEKKRAESQGITNRLHQLINAKEIMQKLITNAPDTYSGTNIELQQKKMFTFQDAVNKAEAFLNSEVEK